MRRVHRNLSRKDVEALRLRLHELVPLQGTTIYEVTRMMRMITRKSQTEYAQMCGVAPCVLTAIEAGSGSPTVETLEKLLRPFGYCVGVVRVAEDVDRKPTRGEVKEARGSKAAETALSRALRKSRAKGG